MRSKIIFFNFITFFFLFSCSITNNFYLEKENIITATQKNDLSLVKELIKNKSDINIFDYYGDNALIIAIKTQRNEIAKFFIDNNIYLTDLNRRNESLIEIAIKSNNSFIFEELLKKIPLEKYEIDEKKLLRLVCSVRNKDMLFVLVEKGANIVLDEYGKTAIEYFSDQKTIDYLIDKINQNNYHLINYGNLFSYLVKENYIASFKVLFSKINLIKDNYIDINSEIENFIKSNYNKEATLFLIEQYPNKSPDFEKYLSIAIKSNNVELSKIILERINEPNNYIELIKNHLISSVKDNKLEMVRFILTKIDINNEDNSSETALSSTLGIYREKIKDKTKIAIAKLLIENGASLYFNTNDKSWTIPNILGKQVNKTFEGFNFLEYVIDNIDILESIAKKYPDSFDLNINYLGEIPLIYAVKQYVSIDIIRFIIKNTKDINRVDNDGKNALYYAKQQNDKVLIETLKQYGAIEK
ncbi:MAG: ankyrin repeat domain-containing protein [Candidatus Sericytochromatia bacterium]